MNKNTLIKAYKCSLAQLSDDCDYISMLKSIVKENDINKTARVYFGIELSILTNQGLEMSESSQCRYKILHRVLKKLGETNFAEGILFLLETKKIPVEKIHKINQKINKDGLSITEAINSTIRDKGPPRERRCKTNNIQSIKKIPNINYNAYCASALYTLREWTDTINEYSEYIDWSKVSQNNKKNAITMLSDFITILNDFSNKIEGKN